MADVNEGSQFYMPPTLAETEWAMPAFENVCKQIQMVQSRDEVMIED